MSPWSTAPAGDAFEALGDPNRRAIIELLARGGANGRSVGDLADQLPISRPAVSRHLRLLKRAGLVIEEPQGTRRIYRLHDAGLVAVRAYLEQVWGDAAGRFRLFAENVAPRTDDAPEPAAHPEGDRKPIAERRQRS
jgi:DNA-binding transcriptional ArsR family regulator